MGFDGTDAMRPSCQNCREGARRPGGVPMKKYLLSLAFAAVSGAGLAQSAIDGTWKLDPQSVQAPTRQSQYMVKDGMYQCLSCMPRYKVKADGQDQPVAHAPYIDTLAVTIVDDHTV